jgi:transposase
MNKQRDFSGFPMNQEENNLFSIWEVSEKLGVPKHTLRFWEKELNGLLVPQRTRGGQRRYTPANVAILAEIKQNRSPGEPGGRGGENGSLQLLQNGKG